jgi:hypothetical protein
MNALPWFRLYSRIMTDPKIESLAFDDQRHFVWLLCMKNEGYLDEKFPSEDARELMISRKLGIRGEALENAKKRLCDVGLIRQNWQPVAWSALQGTSDSSKERTRKYRENKKKKEIEADEERHSDVTVTPQIRLDKSRQDKKREEKSSPNGEHVAGATCPHQEILSLYHEILPELPKHRDWTDSRKKLLKSRWDSREDRQTLDYWRDLFHYIRQSDFLMGRVGLKPFRCSLVWMLNPEKFANITEGKYHEGHAR